jgi:Zn finger protein HypA/HybF involved in hydrogenase expression
VLGLRFFSCTRCGTVYADVETPAQCARCEGPMAELDTGRQAAEYFSGR